MLEPVKIEEKQSQTITMKWTWNLRPWEQVQGIGKSSFYLSSSGEEGVSWVKKSVIHPYMIGVSVERDHDGDTSGISSSAKLRPSCMSFLNLASSDAKRL